MMDSTGEGNWGDPWGAVPESYHKGWPTGNPNDMTHCCNCGKELSSADMPIDHIQMGEVDCRMCRICG